MLCDVYLLCFRLKYLLRIYFKVLIDIFIITCLNSYVYEVIISFARNGNELMLAATLLRQSFAIRLGPNIGTFAWWSGTPLFAHVICELGLAREDRPKHAYK